MNAVEVLAHYETALAAEQTWLAESQELLRFYHDFIDTENITHSNPGVIQYGHRPQPRRPLPSHTIFENVLFASVGNGLWAGMFASISETVGDTMSQAVTGLDTPRHTLRMGSRLQVGCPAAERMFAEGVRQVNGSTEKHQPKHEQEILSVYHADDAEPVLLRKSYESTTALLLEPVFLGIGDDTETIAVPRGTIVSVQNESGAQSPTGVADGPNDEQLRTYEMDPDHLLITPLRLSSWVYNEPTKRAMFSVWSGSRGVPEFCARDWESYGDIEPKHIDQAAQRIMELCGVTS